MTAPVQQQKSANISMNAPIKQATSGLWHVSFIMPSEYNLESLPKPVDERIRIKNVPAKEFIVIVFSGSISSKNVKKHEEQLMSYVKSNNILTTGTPKYAFYNPPWTLPAMRRNEVMIEMMK